MLQDILHVLICEILATLDNFIEIDLHIVGHEIHTSELLIFGSIIVNQIKQI